MSLPPEISQREFYKFRDSGDPTQTRVAAVLEGVIALPTGAATLAEQQAQTALLTTLNAKFANDYGVSSAAVRVAAQIGNAAGNVAVLKTLATAPVDADYGIIVQSILHGHTTAGGGAFVDVKVTPSGALVTSLGDISGVVGQQAMANSIPVAIASNQDFTYTPNAAISKIIALGAQLDDVATATVTENNVAALRLNSSRGLHVSVRDTAGNAYAVATEDTLSSILTRLNNIYSEQLDIKGDEGTSPNGFFGKIGAYAFSGIASAIADDPSLGLLAMTLRRSLHVNIRDSSGAEVLPATSTAQATQTTALQLIDDIVHAANASLSKGVPMMGQLDDTGTATVTEDNVGMARITSARGIHVSPRTPAGASMFDTGSTSGFVKLFDASGLGGVGQTVLNSGGIGIAPFFLIDAGNNFASFNSDGSFRNTGNVAHDAGDTFGPVKTGFRARTTRTSSVAVDDRSDVTGDRQGQQWIDSSEFLIGKATVTSGTDTAVVAAPGANLKIVVYNIAVSGYAGDASGATVADQEGVEFRFASGTYYYQTVWQTVSGEPVSGRAINLAMNPTNIKLQHGHWDGGSNEALNVHKMGLAIAVSATLYVTVAYRIMPT